MRQLRIRKGALAHVDVAAQGYALQRRALERARANDGHVWRSAVFSIVPQTRPHR